jgi:GNAT superfamily N-acetyltransferase
MTSPRQLVPGRPPPARLELREVGGEAASALRSTYVRIGAPHGWTGRATWSDAEWEEELTRPGVRAWLARVDEEVVGLVELEAEPNGDVGIVVFGLVPEFVGKGFGGTLLTVATRLAWDVTSPGGVPTRRVWARPPRATIRTRGRTTNVEAFERSEPGRCGRKRLRIRAKRRASAKLWRGARRCSLVGQINDC